MLRQYGAHTKFIHKHKRQWQKAFQVVLPIGCKEILFYCSCCVKLEFIAQWCGECTEHQCIQEIDWTSSGSLKKSPTITRQTLHHNNQCYFEELLKDLDTQAGTYGPRPVSVCLFITKCSNWFYFTLAFPAPVMALMIVDFIKRFCF